MKEKEIEQFDKLPYRESRWQNLMSRGWNMYDLRFDHNWGRYEKFYKVADRIIESNVGKSFNRAFSKYCEKVPVLEQYWFLREFEGHYANYFIDKNRCIQRSKWCKKYKKAIYLMINNVPVYFKKKDAEYLRAKAELGKAKAKQERIDKKMQEQDVYIILSLKEMANREFALRERNENRK
jgi:hypothetical protein